MAHASVAPGRSGCESDFADGSTHDAQLCGGIGIGPECTDDPQLLATSVTGGYLDVPCTGEGPVGCATPLPTFEPAAKAAAVPLTIPEQTITIDHLGPQEVKLGDATLPNGVLTDASFAFAGGWPVDVALRDGRGRLDVRSSEPGGKPFENHYTHGWHPGTERVGVFLVLDVLWFEPGAQLSIRNVVVR